MAASFLKQFVGYSIGELWVAGAHKIMHHPYIYVHVHKRHHCPIKELVASGLHSICIILQKINEFSEWMVATGLEHNVKYLKPVLPEVQYKVTGYVYEENLWKNPKYTQLKMKNALVNLEEEELVILSTNFLIYS